MRVILASSEVVPYSKTGGLADVAGALPKALSRLGCDVNVVTPKYTGHGQRQGDVVRAETGEILFDDLQVPFAGTLKYARVWRDFQGGASVYFIDNEEYFGLGYIYGAGDFDAERFAFFSRAVLELAKRIGDPPDVIHCNDWQTGFLPAYLLTTYGRDEFFRRTATLFTIHNLAYQGWFDAHLLPRFGLGWDVFEHGLEFHGRASALKAGLYFSTALSTVSPQYAREIQTPEFGHQLDGFLRWRQGSLLGILNGVDYGEWNPEHDLHLPAHYSSDNLAGKTACKLELLRRYQLPENLDKPVVAMISRMVPQKGFDLVKDAIWRILDTGAYFVLLGSGDPHYKDFFQDVRNQRPAQVGVYFDFNNSLAHLIEAGADIFLMPSAYEPSGLNQMYSLKYGTVPLVRGVGGLDDTITNFERTTGRGNGFKFYSYSADRLVEKYYEAALVYYDRELWRRLQRNGMEADYSWERSARSYLDAYERIVGQR